MCKFECDMATFGGAIHVGMSSTLKMNETIFTGNSALVGGAISIVHEAEALITRCGFHENHSVRIGRFCGAGAISILTKSSLVVKGTNVTNNTAGHGGGGLAVQEGSRVVLENYRFLSNSAVVGGALYLIDVSYISTSGRVFFRNEASTDGGAVCLFNSDINSIFYNITCVANQDSSGGCIHVTSSTFILSNSDIKQNGVGSGVVIKSSRIQVCDTVIVLAVAL